MEKKKKLYILYGLLAVLIIGTAVGMAVILSSKNSPPDTAVSSSPADDIETVTTTSAVISSKKSTSATTSTTASASTTAASTQTAVTTTITMPVSGQTETLPPPPPPPAVEEPVPDDIIANAIEPDFVPITDDLINSDPEPEPVVIPDPVIIEPDPVTDPVTEPPATEPVIVITDDPTAPPVITDVPSDPVITTQPPTAPPTQPPTTAKLVTQPPTQAPTQPQSRTKLIHKVPHIYQKYSYPTGCESCAAVSLMQYYGINISIDKFIDSYLPKANLPMYSNGVLYAQSPWDYFIGDPRSSYGYGCYSTCIQKAMNKAMGGTHTACIDNAASLYALAEKYVSKGNPVLVWATMYMNSAYSGTHWTLPNGQGFTFISPEHALVLIGYDDTHFYFSDSLCTGEITSYSRSAAEAAFAALGRQAIVIK